MQTLTLQYTAIHVPLGHLVNYISFVEQYQWTGKNESKHLRSVSLRAFSLYIYNASKVNIRDIIRDDGLIEVQIDVFKSICLWNYFGYK